MLTQNCKKDLVQIMTNNNIEFKIEDYLNVLFNKLETKISA